MSYNQFIKNKEGFRNVAYRDGDKWAIGYGNQNWPNGKPVKEGDRITKENAELIYQSHAEGIAAAVDKVVKVPLTPSQRDALVSFGYNAGVGALQGSTLLRKLNAGDYEGAANEFGKWTKGDGGTVLPGLVSRRAEERAMFLGQKYNPGKQSQSSGGTTEVPSVISQQEPPRPALTVGQQKQLALLHDPNTSLYTKKQLSRDLMGTLMNTQQEVVNNVQDITPVRDHLRSLGNGQAELVAPPQPAVASTPQLHLTDYSQADPGPIIDTALTHDTSALGASNMVQGFAQDHPILTTIGKVGIDIGGRFGGTIAGARIGGMIGGPWGALGGGIIGSFAGGSSANVANNYIDTGRIEAPTTEQFIAEGIYAPFGGAASGLKAMGILGKATLGSRALTALAGESIGGAGGALNIAKNAGIQGAINVGVDNLASGVTGNGTLSVGENALSFTVGAGTKIGFDAWNHMNGSKAAQRASAIESKLFPNRSQPNAQRTPLEPNTSILDENARQKVAVTVDKANQNRLQNKQLELDSTETLTQRLQQQQKEVQYLNILEDVEGSKAETPGKVIKSRVQELQILEQAKTANDFNARQSNSSNFVDPVLEQKIAKANTELNKVYETLYPGDINAQTSAKDFHYKTILEGTDTKTRASKLKAEMEPIQIELDGRAAQAQIEGHKRATAQQPYFNESRLIQTALSVDANRIAQAGQLLDQVNLLPAERQEAAKLLNNLQLMESIQDGDVGDLTSILNAVRNENPLLGPTLDDVYGYVNAKTQDIAYKIDQGGQPDRTELELVNRIATMSHLMTGSTRDSILPTPLAQQFKEILGDTVIVKPKGDKTSVVSINGADQYAKGILPEKAGFTSSILSEFNNTLNEISAIGVTVDLQAKDLFGEVSTSATNFKKTPNLTKEDRLTLNKAIDQAQTLQRLQQNGLNINKNGTLEINKNLEDGVRNVIANKLAMWNDKYLNNLIEASFGPEFSLGPRGEKVTYTRHLNELHAKRTTRTANLNIVNKEVKSSLNSGKSIDEAVRSSEFVQNQILSDEARVLAEREVQRVNKAKGFENETLGLLTDHQKLFMVEKIQGEIMDRLNTSPLQREEVLNKFVNKYKERVANRGEKVDAGTFEDWFNTTHATTGGMSNGATIFSDATSQAKYVVKKMDMLVNELPQVNTLQEVLTKTGNLFSLKRIEPSTVDMNPLKGHAKNIRALLTKANVITKQNAKGFSVPQSDANIINGIRRWMSGLSRIQLVSAPLNSMQVAREDSMIRSTQNRMIMEELGVKDTGKITKSQKDRLKLYGYDIKSMVTAPIDNVKGRAVKGRKESSSWFEQARDDFAPITTNVQNTLRDVEVAPKDFREENLFEMLAAAPWRATALAAQNDLATKAIKLTDSYLQSNLPGADAKQQREVFDSFYYDLMDRSKAGLRAFIASGTTGMNISGKVANFYNPAELHASWDALADELLTNDTPFVQHVARAGGFGLKFLNDGTFRFTGWYPEVVRKHTDILNENFTKYRKISNSGDKALALQEFGNDLFGYGVYASLFSPNALWQIGTFGKVLSVLGMFGAAKTIEEERNAWGQWSVWSQEIPGMEGASFDMDKFDSGPEAIISQIMNSGDSQLLLKGLYEGLIAKEGQTISTFAKSFSRTMPGRAIENMFAVGKIAGDLAEHPEWSSQEKALYIADVLMSAVQPGQMKNVRRATGMNTGLFKTPTKYSSVEIANRDYPAGNELWMDDESYKTLNESASARAMVTLGSLLGLMPKEATEAMERSALEIQSGFLPNDYGIQQKVNEFMVNKSRTAQQIEAL